MSLKFVSFCAVLAVARAGYLQPAISVPTIRYAHSVAPVAIPQPPITYTVPGKSFAEPLPPVITTSYGYKSDHTPVPAPIIRSEPVHVAPTPAFIPAPAIAAAPLPVPALGHFADARVALGAGYATGFGLAAPSTFGYAGHLGGYSAGYRLAAPAAVHAAPLAVPAPIGYAGVAPFAYGNTYASGFGLAAPSTFGYAGHLGGYSAGYRLAAPAAIHAAPLAVPSPIAYAGVSPFAYGKTYASGFGLGQAGYAGW